MSKRKPIMMSPGDRAALVGYLIIQRSEPHPRFKIRGRWRDRPAVMTFDGRAVVTCAVGPYTPLSELSALDLPDYLFEDAP